MITALLAKLRRRAPSRCRPAGGCAPRPRIVCLCGSTRFMAAFQLANLQETLAGKIVLSIGCNTKSDADLMAAGQMTEELKMRLDELHKRKIELADEVLVLNVGGYIGESTRSEIAHAKKLGKPVRYMEHNEKADARESASVASSALMDGKSQTERKE